MNRLPIVRTLLAGLLVWGTSVAAPVFQPAGPNLTYGAASNADTAFMAGANPAAAALAVDEDAGVRMGLVPNLGASYEIGDVDDFASEVEDLIDALDTQYATVAEAQAAVERFNAVLPAIGRKGYARVAAAANVPAFPLLVRTTGTLAGVWSVDINLAAEGWAGVLDAPVTRSGQRLDSMSSAYVKGAEVTELALGYSRPVTGLGPGRLLLGARLKYLRMALSKQVVLLSSAQDSDSIGALIEDNYRDNQHTTAAATLDTGVVWAGDHARLGLAVSNLTEPQFDYGAIGFDCGALTDPLKQADCNAAAYFSERIDRTETHTLERQATLSAELGFIDGTLTLAGACDLNAVNDPVGTEQQWATLAAGFQPGSWWIPELRLGYRRNLAGSELSLVTAGVSLLRVVNLDVGYGLEKTHYEGDTYPRTAAVNLGVEAQF